MPRITGENLRLIWDVGQTGETRVALTSLTFDKTENEIEVTDAMDAVKEYLNDKPDQSFSFEGYFRDDESGLPTKTEKRCSLIFGGRRFTGSARLNSRNVTGSIGSAVTQSYNGRWTGTVIEAAYEFDEKEITAFTFKESAAFTETIDSTAGTIAITVAEGTAVTALVAYFDLSPNATAAVSATPQVSGVTANDFSTPVAYTVTAEDGTTKTWTVTVTVDS